MPRGKTSKVPVPRLEEKTSKVRCQAQWHTTRPGPIPARQRRAAQHRRLGFLQLLCGDAGASDAPLCARPTRCVSPSTVTMAAALPVEALAVACGRRPRVEVDDGAPAPINGGNLARKNTNLNCPIATTLAALAILVVVVPYYEIDTIVRTAWPRGASYYSAGSSLPVSRCPPVEGQHPAGKRGAPVLQRLSGAEPGHPPKRKNPRR